MTNREWLEKLNDEEFARVVAHDADYCFPNEVDGNCTYNGCTKCALKWLTQEHPNPMPELKAGMFVEADNGFGAGIGIITVDDDNNMIVVYFTRGWDFVSNVTINKIYKARCQDDCNSYHIVWKKS